MAGGAGTVAAELVGVGATGHPAHPHSVGFTVEKLRNERVTELGPREPPKARVSSPPSGSVWVTTRGRDAAFSKVQNPLSPSQASSKAEATTTGQGVSVTRLELLSLPTGHHPALSQPRGRTETHVRPSLLLINTCVQTHIHVHSQMAVRPATHTRNAVYSHTWTHTASHPTETESLTHARSWSHMLRRAEIGTLKDARADARCRHTQTCPHSYAGLHARNPRSQRWKGPCKCITQPLPGSPQPSPAAAAPPRERPALGPGFRVKEFS